MGERARVISSRWVQNVCVVALQGPSFSDEELIKEYADTLQLELCLRSSLVIDISAMQYVGAEVLSVIIRTRQAVLTINGRFAMLDDTRRLGAVLEDCDMRAVPWFGTLGEAISFLADSGLDSGDVGVRHPTAPAPRPKTLKAEQPEP